MSGGGGKGGSETTETTIPDWIKQPAIRNLQRAEDVQRIEYMPYYGADVAAFTPTQNAAFDANIGAAEAFGLLAPGHGLTATSGMPTPTDFDGFTGYSSQPMYESALAELKAKQPGAVAQYDALFGANVPTQRNWAAPQNRGGGGGGGNYTPTTTTPRVHTTSGWKDGTGEAAAKIMDDLNYERGKIIDPINNPNQLGAGDKEAQANWERIKKAGGYAAVKQAEAKKVADTWARKETQLATPRTPVYSSKLDSKGYTPKPSPITAAGPFKYLQKKK